MRKLLKKKIENDNWTVAYFNNENPTGPGSLYETVQEASNNTIIMPDPSVFEKGGMYKIVMEKALTITASRSNLYIIANGLDFVLSGDQQDIRALTITGSTTVDYDILIQGFKFNYFGGSPYQSTSGVTYGACFFFNSTKDTDSIVIRDCECRYNHSDPAQATRASVVCSYGAKVRATFINCKFCDNWGNAIRSSNGQYYTFYGCTVVGNYGRDIYVASGGGAAWYGSIYCKWGTETGKLPSTVGFISPPPDDVYDVLYGPGELENTDYHLADTSEYKDNFDWSKEEFSFVGYDLEGWERIKSSGCYEWEREEPEPDNTLTRLFGTTNDRNKLCLFAIRGLSINYDDVIRRQFAEE